MKYLCLGESLIDIFIQSGKEKIYHIIGGAALNYATIYAWLQNDQVTLLTNIGDDIHGTKIKDFLTSNKIKLLLLNQEDDFTLKALVKIKEDKKAEFKFMQNKLGRVDVSKLPSLEDFDVINFTSAFYLWEETYYDQVYLKLLKTAVKLNKIIVFDPNYRKDVWENDISFFKRSLEFLKTAKIIKLKDDDISLLEEQAQAMGLTVEIKNLVRKDAILLNTKANNQIDIYHNGEKLTYELESVIDSQDTTGAGDVLVSAFVNSICQQKITPITIKKALEQATEVLTKSLQSRGALGFINESFWIDDKIQF